MPNSSIRNTPLPCTATFVPPRLQELQSRLPLRQISDTAQQFHASDSEAWLLAPLSPGMFEHESTDRLVIEWQEMTQNSAHASPNFSYPQRAQWEQTSNVQMLGWRKLECYINKDGSLTESAKLLVAEAQNLPPDTDQGLVFPLILSIIDELRGGHVDLYTLRQRYAHYGNFIKYVELNGTLTELGVIKGYGYRCAVFEPFTAERFVEILELNKVSKASELDIFKRYGVNPRSIRKYISYGSEQGSERSARLTSAGEVFLLAAGKHKTDFSFLQ